MKMTDYFADRAAEWDKPGKIGMADNFVQALLTHIAGYVSDDC